jgi:hypothetical protein
MNYDEARQAAEVCRRYAAGVESKLYMDMTVAQAREAIALAAALAVKLDKYADELDTIPPEEA